MTSRILFATTIAISLTACTEQTAQPQEPPAVPMVAEPLAETATSDILGADGSPIGVANFIEGPNGLLLRVEIAPGGLTPGWHGLHLHQVGDCSDHGIFKLSGGHVGKVDGGHGLLNPAGPEGGDIPNIWASADGSVGYEAFTRLTDLSTLTDANGSALLIHEAQDDHSSQPIGGAGARVACGVIQKLAASRIEP
ncbi:MAG: superoxide dismutase family protein [Hyphomonas sp.]